jgi:hypothetical protein
VDVEKESKI